MRQLVESEDDQGKTSSSRMALYEWLISGNLTLLQVRGPVHQSCNALVSMRWHYLMMSWRGWVTMARNIANALSLCTCKQYLGMKLTVSGRGALPVQASRTRPVSATRRPYQQQTITRAAMTTTDELTKVPTRKHLVHLCMPLQSVLVSELPDSVLMIAVGAAGGWRCVAGRPRREVWQRAIGGGR